MTLILFIMMVFLLLCSSFFSASETAITAASKAKIHNKAKEGDKRAKLTSKLLDELGTVISAILVGNTIFNTCAVSLATGLLVTFFGQEGIAYASIIMGAVIILFGEVIPKYTAVQIPEAFLLKTSIVLSFVYKILRPLTVAMRMIAELVLKLFKFDSDSLRTPEMSLEELKGAIDLHHVSDWESSERKAMLKSIMDLTSVQVEEIMVHRKNIFMIDASDSTESIVNQLLSSPFTRIPLWKDDPDNVIGVVNVKALLRAVQLHEGNLEKLDVVAIAHKPWFIPENTSLLEQMQAFRSRREHFAIVVDEYGALMGVVTLEDILEEIVGDISDEHDVSVTGVHSQSDGSYIVDGTVTIRDLNRQLHWGLPDEDASTIAGLLLYEVREIPSVGQVFMVHNFKFEVLRRQRNQITLLRIIPPEGLGAGGRHDYPEASQ